MSPCWVLSTENICHFVPDIGRWHCIMFLENRWLNCWPKNINKGHEYSGWLLLRVPADCTYKCSQCVSSILRLNVCTKLKNDNVSAGHNQGSETKQNMSVLSFTKIDLFITLFEQISNEWVTYLEVVSEFKGLNWISEDLGLILVEKEIRRRS